MVSNKPLGIKGHLSTRYPCLVVAISCLAIGLGTAASAYDRSALLDKKLEVIQRDITISGEFVHNVGQLQMNITNWGLVGSLPLSQYPMSTSPSAQWPSGSGIEYLYAAGLWIGAQKNGIPFVSTSYPETEFYPQKGSIHTIYRGREGDLNGTHYPDNPDDDDDGRIDEDWLNGMDDDGDGLIDEDYAAISQQMFSCSYTDDQDVASIIWPEHTPMNLFVRQETYQWGEEDFDDFVAVRYYVSNRGLNLLDGVYIGIYADVDAGPLSFGSYYMDDQVGYIDDIRCAPYGDEEIPIRVSVAYVYDGDGDDGRTPGYFGIALIDYAVYVKFSKYDYTKMPSRLWTSTNAFRVFRGLQSFDSGGEPTNDNERYQVLSSRIRDEDTSIPNDYKILMSIGPFLLDTYDDPYDDIPVTGRENPFDDPLEINIAYVCGEGLDGMLQTAANATLLFRGCWVDHDGDPLTGVNGLETPVTGPLDMWRPDPCASGGSVIDVPAKEVCWSNLDCSRELWEFTNYTGCYTSPFSNFGRYVTGISGKEHQVFWVAGSAPPPPKMRLVPGDGKVIIFWDNTSETVADPLSLKKDFEGYQIWRADSWHRPLGTSIITGPAEHLWNLLETRDIVNGVKPDNDFKMPYSQGGWIYEPLTGMEGREQLLSMFEESIIYAPMDTVPCPPGLDREVCDTLEAMARYDLGFEGGKLYYKYVDTEARNGMPYFYSVTAYDHKFYGGVPSEPDRYSLPASNFAYVEPCSESQEASGFRESDVYVVPNPVTNENMEPWRLGPTNTDPSGLKCEFRNLPACRCAVRIFTVSGDLVQILHHDGSEGNGTLKWNLLSKNGQDIMSGIYLYSVEPEEGSFPRVIGKFVVIR
jgi:hypothetical protein